MLTRIVADEAAVGEAAAAIVATAIRSHPPKAPFLLGCPGGRSPRSTYRALAVAADRERLDLSRVVIVMMDDYLDEGPDGALTRVDPGAAHSCERFAREEILRVVNAAVPARSRIPDEAVWLPDPNEPQSYDERIRRAGGVGVFLLASGATDGHIAFNPPGSSYSSRTRTVALAQTTRRDNLATFPSFGGELAAVPRHGVSIGIGSIRDLSHRVVMVVHGSDKRLAARRLRTAVRYEQDWPATIAAECAQAQLIVDRAAAGLS